MKAGTKDSGINCILMSSEVKEIDVLSGYEQEGLIELNLSTGQAFSYFRQLYNDWDVIIEKSVQQEIHEERDGNTNVATIRSANWQHSVMITSNSISFFIEIYGKIYINKCIGRDY
jgi:hypothetical protein